MQKKITVELVLDAYRNGYFPMSDDRTSEQITWHSPDMRGILPLETFHVPISLRKFMQKGVYELRINTAFEQVIRACADTITPTRKATWINDTIIELYTELAQRGYAYAFETWHNHLLVGGLYGVAIGGAFFGESMFSTHTNASKFALVKLVEHLKSSGYVLLDAQYHNPHLEQFGIIEIPKAEYYEKLQEALSKMPQSLL